MASGTNYQTTITNASGDVQSGISCELKKWDGSAYVGVGVTASTNTDGVASFLVPLTGKYQLWIGGVAATDVSDFFVLGDDFEAFWSTTGTGGTLGMSGLAATATELNRNDGVTAGVVTAGKTIVAGTDKTIDEIDIGQLTIDGVLVSATATELNTLAGIIATVNELNLLSGLTGSVVTTTSSVFTELSDLVNNVLSNKTIDLSARHKTFQIDVSNKTGLSTGTYKTVEIMAAKGGNFVIEGILITDYSNGSNYVTNIQINKVNQAAVSTTLKDVTLSSYTTLGDVKYLKDNFNFNTSIISSEDLVEIKVKVSSGTTANCKINIFYRNVPSATQNEVVIT